MVPVVQKTPNRLQLMKKCFILFFKHEARCLKNNMKEAKAVYKECCTAPVAILASTYCIVVFFFFLCRCFSDKNGALKVFLPLFLLQGFPVGPQHMLPEQFADVHRSISPASAAQQQVTNV